MSVPLKNIRYNDADASHAHTHTTLERVSRVWVRPINIRRLNFLTANTAPTRDAIYMTMLTVVRLVVIISVVAHFLLTFFWSGRISTATHLLPIPFGIGGSHSGAPLKISHGFITPFDNNAQALTDLTFLRLVIG